MSVDISPEIIKLTQESLGEFVKKPALSEKLLRKPPFRFLHDIITAVQNNTGFFDGLFTEEELVSDNVKDRDSKIAFLNKVIDVVNIVTDSSLSVRSSKIIAGLEPEKTNELLQQLGVALRQNINSKNAVQNVALTKKSSKTSSNKKITEQNPKQIIRKVDNKKPQTDPKVTNNNSVNNKAKTKSIDRKTSRDKGKHDTASDSDKASVKSNKSDIPKKPKVKEKTTTKLKTNKSGEKPVNGKKQLLLSEISNDGEDVLPLEGHGKRVELTDILDDSDDLNSIEPEIINIENNKQLSKEVSEINNTNKPSEAKMISDDEHREEKTVKNNGVPRPQSRLSRQRSGIKVTADEDDNKDVVHREVTEATVGNTIQSANRNRINQEDNQEIASDRGSGDSKTRSVRTASSKRSAKVRPEPLKATHSISVESKSDNDGVDRKPGLSEVSIRQSRPPSANLRPPSVRPSSARPGAPRLKEKNVDVIVTPSEPAVVGKVHVIVENYENVAEDDEGGVEVMQIAADDNLISGDNADAKSNSISKGHGFLVQQILETQKELSHDETSKVGIEWEYGSRREREASYKEIEGIRNGLQLLSRASNPLGKLMDYIQEDVEVMRQELMQWREARISASMELKQQQRLTDEQVQPLQAKLKQIENLISEQVELIYTVKSNIHRNTQKIIKLVDGEE